MAKELKRLLDMILIPVCVGVIIWALALTGVMLFVAWRFEL